MNPSRDLPTRITSPEPPRSIRSPGSTPLLSAEELAAFGRREAARFAAERRRAAQVGLERAVGRSAVPRRFLALAVCRAYANGFEQTRRRGGGLLLLGGPGTGKTHLACATLARVIHAGHRARS
jgi:DNA replication protein DnaC